MHLQHAVEATALAASGTDNSPVSRRRSRQQPERMIGPRTWPAAALLLVTLLVAAACALPGARDGGNLNIERYRSGEAQQGYPENSWATRKISQRALKGMELFTARGYGKREGCSGRLCSRRMELTGARLYGKRNASANQFKCFFMDCRHLEGSRLDEMRFYPNSLERPAVLMPDD